MQTCPIHNVLLKPLFSSSYCPSCAEEIKVELETQINFEDLPRKDQRIWFAKDVLTQLKHNKIKANAGTFIRYGISLNAAQKYENVCKVCALGALTISFIARRGDLADVIDHNIRVDDNPDNTRKYIHRILSPYFESTQLDMIEAAFEQSSHYGISTTSDELVPARDWGNRLRAEQKLSTNSILIAIMQNIVDNDGVFVP